MISITLKMISAAVIKHDVDRLETHELTAVIGDNEENKSWAKYTPSGTLTFNVSNPNCFNKIVAGKQYYVTITEAE